MSLSRLLSTNPLIPWVLVAAVSEPEVVSQSALLVPDTIPTGQCVTRRREGDRIVCADSSMLRSMILRPTPPPTAVMNARRLKRYEIIFASSEFVVWGPWGVYGASGPRTANAGLAVVARIRSLKVLPVPAL